MALAEARAAWQRTANRCLVQEDAKRAPRLACCSSVPPSSKHEEMVPTTTPNVQDIPTSNSLPFSRTPSYSNLSPSSRWWLQMQPNYELQKGLMDEHYDPGIVDHTSPVDNQCRNLITSGMKDVKDEKFGFEADFKDEGFVSIEVSKNSNDLYFDSESSWVGVERNTPWWRTADTEELALIVAQRSLDLIENCDLPMPQNTNVKKNLKTTGTGRCLNHDDMSGSLLKSSIGSHPRLYTHNSAPASLTGPDKPLSPIEKRKPEMTDEEGSKAQLLEALRHSQTRAREAEKVAKEACAEKEHVVKLVFRQASQLFAYKQWLQLLQLENMCFQIKNNQTPFMSPEVVPWTTPRGKKVKKGWPKTSSRKRAKRSRCQYDVGRYAIVFALGLGLVGAGLFLGWTIGWMLPTW